MRETRRSRQRRQESQAGDKEKPSTEAGITTVQAAREQKDKNSSLFLSFLSLFLFRLSSVHNHFIFLLTHFSLSLFSGAATKYFAAKTHFVSTKPAQSYRVWYSFVWRCPWCNGYRRRKWTRRHEFKTWTRLIEFHKALIPLGKVWIQ